MGASELDDLIRFVRERSPYYRELYREVPDGISSTTDLPIVDQSSFWNANTLGKNRVLTGPMEEGLVLRSGGTTGSPKFSVFSREEWHEFTREFGVALSTTGVRDGDRVANLFYSGELYGSFIFTHRVIEVCPVKLLSLPIGGSAPVAEVAKILSDFQASVVAGLPTTIMSLIAFFETRPEWIERCSIRLILFAGEAMYDDQRKRISAVLPRVEIRSIGYASNDAGFLGYVDGSCGPNEFRRNDRSTVFEILDEESGDPILEEGKSGRAVVTDLRRKLMPILRYPVGDRAMWIENEGVDRKFRLLGRTGEAARVSSFSVYYDDIHATLHQFSQALGAFQFQILTTHEQNRDRLVVRIGLSDPKSTPDSKVERLVLAAICKERPTLEQFIAAGKVLPPRIEWCAAEDLERNPRTGKLKRIIDLRARLEETVS